MNGKDVLFSVVLPCYNRAAFIETTIRSVQNQNYQHWELIIVNDGSTDETENIVKSISDNRIKYIAIPNSERGAARNVGIKTASGNFICFLDSDDQLLPNHLLEANSFIHANPSKKIFHQGFEIRDQNNVILFSSKKLAYQINDELIRNNVISPNGIFISAEIAKANLFKEDRALAGTEDYELWLRLASKYSIYHHPVCTSILIDHEQRSMKESDLQKLVTRINLFIEYVDKNEAVKSWLGKSYNEFKAWRFSYIALHASLSNQKKQTLKYLMKAVGLYPPLIFTKRFFIVCRNIFS